MPGNLVASFKEEEDLLIFVGQRVCLLISKHAVVIKAVLPLIISNNVIRHETNRVQEML